MSFKKIFIYLLTGITLLFIVQNMSMVEIRFFFWSFALPLALFLPVMLIIGFAIGWLWHTPVHDEKKP